jgi:pimeloyl-ACP methyl ester carboxylesterase
MQQPSGLAVVICHGNYHTPAPYCPLISALQAKGIEAYCPQLPTSDLSMLNVGEDISNPDYDLGPPAAGYPQGEEDVDAVLQVLQPLVEEQGKNVLLIGHSYGGWVATEAARPELQARKRKEQGEGLVGGIIGILYVGAFIIPVGESVHTFFQPKDGSFVQPHFMRFHVSHINHPSKPLFREISFDSALFPLLCFLTHKID